jgi:hypothetical protein
MEYIKIIIQSNVKKQKCDELDPLYCEEEDIIVKALNMFEKSLVQKEFSIQEVVNTNEKQNACVANFLTNDDAKEN